MIYKFPQLLVGILTLFIIHLPPVLADPCPIANPRSTVYQRRDKNRCEGMLNTQVVNQKLDLIAFSTGHLSQYPTTLKIRVPRTNEIAPQLTVRSSLRNYLLNEVDLKANDADFSFNLNTATVLKREKIPPQSLRGNAIVSQNFRQIYFPVIFNKPTNYYDIILYSTREITLSTVQLRRNGKVIPSNLKVSNRPQRGEIAFRWQYGRALGGLYELYLKDAKGNEYLFYLGHNTNWLDNYEV